MPTSGTSPSAGRPALQHPAELLATGRPADAAEALLAVVAEAPIYAAAHVLLGVALDAAGRPAEALAAWNRAAFLVPRSPLVLRERQRLLDVTRAASPESVHSAKPGALPSEQPAPPDDPLTDSAEAPAPSSEPSTDSQGLQPDPADLPARGDELLLAPAHDRPDAFDPEEVPVIETAPLDDFFFADATPAGDADGFDPDGFDPDGFDFSAFDLGDDGLEPLPPLDAPPDVPLTDNGFEADTGGIAAPPIPDWADQDDSSGVRLVLPDDGLASTPPPAPAPPERDMSWAVFEDLPAGGVLDRPVSDMLASDALPPLVAPPPGDLLGDAAWATDAWADAAWPVNAWDTGAPPPAHTTPTEDDPEAVLPDSAPEPAPEPDPGHADAPGDTAPAEASAATPPPSASVFNDPDGSVGDDLDSLIASLESAPRIRPDPAFSGPSVRVATADVDEMASETLARIYAAQHQYVQAAIVYETLAAREPERAAVLLQQAAEMRRRRP
ncbi:MAG TPA: hypothetical protein VF594_00035 [Rubricoccaceae bacterium]|jgi:hypothetical protein